MRLPPLKIYKPSFVCFANTQEGVVHSGGKIYDLKSTGRRQRARRRRDVQGGNSSDVNGDNNNMDDEEEEEFEVEVFSDPAADGSDSLPKREYSAVCVPACLSLSVYAARSWLSRIFSKQTELQQLW